MIRSWTIFRSFCSNKLHNLIQSIKKQHKLQLTHSVSNGIVSIQLNIDKQFRKIKTNIEDTLRSHGFQAVVTRQKSTKRIFDSANNISKIKSIVLLIGDLDERGIVNQLNKTNSVEVVSCQTTSVEISRQLYLKQWDPQDILLLKLQQDQLNLDVIRNLPIKGAIIGSSKEMSQLLSILNKMNVQIYGCIVQNQQDREIFNKYGLGQQSYELEQTSKLAQNIVNYAKMLKRYLYYNTTTRKIEYIQNGNVLINFDSGQLRKVYSREGDTIDPEVFPTMIKKAGNAYIVNWSDGFREAIYTMEFLQGFSRKS